MKVTFFLVNSKNFIHKVGGEIIKAVEKTDFSHTAVMIEYKGQEYIYHAVWPKVRRDSLSSFRQDYDLAHKYSIELDQDPLVIYNYMQMLLGKKYSILQLCLIYLKRISAFINKISKGWILNHENHLICCEINAMFLVDFLGFKFDSKLDSVGLKEIQDACLKLKELK